MSPPSTARAVRERPPADGRSLRTAPRPRRVSGPARAPAGPRSRGPARPEQGVAERLALSLKVLARPRTLDRLIRGRAWIGLVAFALIGIVTLQLGLLQLNSRIGRDLRRETVLQRENATLGIENSELAAAERVEALAAHMGMRAAPESAIRFLNGAHRGDVAKAAAALQAPVSRSEASTGTAEASSQAASTAAASTPASGSSESSPGAAATAQAGG